MKTIKLSKNKEVLVDDEDYVYLNQFKWNCNQGYAKRTISMHDVIMNNQSDLIVDHINGNPLDNRKQNLRLVTVSQNQMNNKKRNNTSSIYKGVSWNKDHKKWKAYIMANKKYNHLGYFIREIDAAKAYNKAALTYFGEYARINKIEDN